MRQIVLIVHNVRSCHNVGSMLRTAEGLGIEKVYLTGYTPYPVMKKDARLPYLAHKIAAQIHKTALGAENMVRWEHEESVEEVIKQCRVEGYHVVALEQAERSIPLHDLIPLQKIAVIVGREVEGIEPAVLAMVDQIIEIPMYGQKESLNVSVAAAIALYELGVA